MPLYTYECKECTEFGEVERMVTIKDRDRQYCGYGHLLARKLDFIGAVFSETTNGGMKR